MDRISRLIIFSVTAALMIAMASPVAATEDTTEDETTATTVVPEQIMEGEGPAVEAPPAEEAEPDQPWTSRFIYPALVGATILLIIGLVIGYNHSIRNRYQVVS